MAVNPIDTYLRGGAVQMPLPKPFVIGCDLAGVVEKLGPGARRFKVGDRVWGSNQGLLGRQGTFAERCCAHEDFLYPTPPGVKDAITQGLKTRKEQLLRTAFLSAARNDAEVVNHQARRLVESQGKLTQ